MQSARARWRYRAQARAWPGGEELPFSEAQLYFELNHTDGDLGIHGLIDGDAWKSLEIEAPGEKLLMNVWIRGSLRQQGMTEIFFESDEPSFDELPPAAFFKRFPQGVYEIGGITLEDEELEAEIRLSHVMAGPPGGIKINGKNSAVELRCDAAGRQRAGDARLERRDEIASDGWHAECQRDSTEVRSGRRDRARRAEPRCARFQVPICPAT